MVIAVVCAGLLVVALRPDLLSMPAPQAGPVPEETLPVTAGGRPAGPFVGSPAERYADGAAGFVMPRARALGGLPEKDVARALDRTRELLAAAHLDRRTLMGGRPDAFVRALDRSQRPWFREHLDTRGDGFDTRRWVASFAPRTAELSTPVIKVDGTATVAAARQDGAPGVKIRLNHLIVYAVHRPGQPGTTIRVVLHATGTVLAHRVNGRPALWVKDWGYTSTPVRCDVEDAFVHPLYDDSPPDKVGGTGAPSDPYDLDDEPDDEGGCSRSEGT
ncbi:hypothetical protein [Nonomuraea lactucae]|uniref:hypothetical protein n=1 Tax=Nonomuraea lactucae TaxID=2249762 RepID=UPI000DE1B279|nr:hypothetical protein [Nonomuraea lactucae]